MVAREAQAYVGSPVGVTTAAGMTLEPATEAG